MAFVVGKCISGNSRSIHERRGFSPDELAISLVEGCGVCEGRSEYADG
jgi:hypothetical protein